MCQHLVDRPQWGRPDDGSGGGVIAAHDAPFPREEFKAAARVFPTLVPITPDDPASAANRAAWEGLRRFDRPFLTAFSDRDPITAGGQRPLQKLVPGARNRDHVTIEGAGHFLQEDRGPELARVVLEFITATPR
jgi:haloalkane dehalogenase